MQVSICGTRISRSFARLRRRVAFLLVVLRTLSLQSPLPDRPIRTDPLAAQYGSPAENPAFWAAIWPNAHVDALSGPLQLHHGTADESVPLRWSDLLYEQLLQAGRPAEIYTYEGDNHNISGNLSLALQRSVAFSDTWVKGAQEPG